MGLFPKIPELLSLWAIQKLTENFVGIGYRKPLLHHWCKKYALKMFEHINYFLHQWCT